MRNLICVIAGLFITAMVMGCADKDEDLGIGYFPKINVIVTYNANDPDLLLSTDTFAPGDIITFSVRVSDNDLDVDTLWATLYMADSEDPYDGPEEIPLTAQTSSSQTYYEIYTTTAPITPGEYSMVFQAEDERGNLSATKAADFTVE